MTSLRQMVVLIPVKYRALLLDQNVIYKAVPNSLDSHMQILHTVWATFVDPEGENDLACPYCINNILTSFRDLQSELVALAKEEKLLEAL